MGLAIYIRVFILFALKCLSKEANYPRHLLPFFSSDQNYFLVDSFEKSRKIFGNNFSKTSI